VPGGPRGLQNRYAMCIRAGQKANFPQTIFAWTLCGLPGCDVGHEHRDFHVPRLRGMLVDQRRTSGGVAGPSHHLGRGGAELRGQGERGVPAVMEMEVAEPDLVPGGPPRPIHVVRPQRPPVGSGEDGAVGRLGRSASHSVRASTAWLGR